MKKGRNGGISLLPNFVLDKTVLTSEEKENILSSLRAVKSFYPNEKNTALSKLSSMLGESYIDWLEADLSPWYHTKEDSDKFETLKTAVIKRKCINFQYYNIKGEKTNRKAEPLKLCLKSGSWYLYAYCLLREDNRFFKLRRMKNLQIIDIESTHTAPPTIFRQAPYEGPYILLKLRISSQTAYRVYEEFDSYEEQKDGSFIVETNFPDSDWLEYYISSFGPYCEVIAPETIRNKIKLQLQKTLQLYR